MILNAVVSFLYYVLSAFIAFIILRNIIKTKNAQEAVLYCIMIIPFVLRVLRLK